MMLYRISVYLLDELEEPCQNLLDYGDERESWVFILTGACHCCPPNHVNYESGSMARTLCIVK